MQHTQKGGEPMAKRDAKHQEAQKQGRQRDNGICQLCGSRKHPEGHHIVDYQFGGNADVCNIVTLCRKCHKNVHRGKIDIFVS